MSVLSFLSQRIASAFLLLLAVSVFIFLITDILPGDVASRILGRAPDPERLQILRQRLGLDQPLPLRYLNWLTHALQGDLGVSLVSGQKVNEIVFGRLYNSSLLAFAAFLLYIPIAVIPAMLQAVNYGRAIDQILSTLTLAILSIPDFLLATILLLAFANFIPMAPARSTIDSSMNVVEIVSALVLPAITIALVMGTYAIRYLRDSLIDALQTDYVKMARLNGIPERNILWQHALPNALVPALNITSLNLTYLFGGVVVVEQVFAFPGFGALLVGSMMQLDIPVIQATVLISSAVYICGNVFADIAAMMLNPKLRHAN